MKVNYKQLLLWILSAVLFIAMFIGMAGCDAAKQQQKAWSKFIKYGGKVNCKGDTLWKYDTTYLDGKIVIDSFPVPCKCPEPVIGYTNKQLRMFLRHQKDSMNYLLKLEKIRTQKMEDSLNGLLKIERQRTKQLKEETKQEKEETKQIDDIEDSKQAKNRSPWIWVIMAGMGLAAIYMIKKW